MAVDFLTAKQKAQYGQWCGQPNEVQLTRYFHLNEADLAFISDGRGDHNRLGCALQLISARFFRNLPCKYSSCTRKCSNIYCKAAFY